MLKFEVPDLSQVDEPLRGFYAKTEGDAHRLQITGLETADELREAKRRERDLRNEAVAKLHELEATQSDREYKFAEAQAESAKTLAKIPAALRVHAHGSPEYLAALAAYEATEHSAYIAKLMESSVAALQAQIEGMRADRDRVIEDNAVHDIATEVVRNGCDPMLLHPHIRDLLQGRRDEDGKFSEATRAEVAAQLRGNPAFERIIAGASAEEKAAHARKVAETIGEKPPTQPVTRKQFESLSPERRAASVRAGATILDG